MTRSINMSVAAMICEITWTEPALLLNVVYVQTFLCNLRELSVLNFDTDSVLGIVPTFLLSFELVCLFFSRLVKQVNQFVVIGYWFRYVG